MADVIFNGSGARKPVGQASIELVFDNSEGKLVGEYASFGEISIKRKVTRDRIFIISMVLNVVVVILLIFSLVLVWVHVVTRLLNRA